MMAKSKRDDCHSAISLLVLSAVIALATGCGVSDSAISRAVDELMPLETRAIELRHTRFELADSIRFAQERLMSMAADDVARQSIEKRIQEFSLRKEKLVSESLALADTVDQSLRRILNTLRSDDDKNRFHEKFNAELRARGLLASAPPE